MMNDWDPPIKRATQLLPQDVSIQEILKEKAKEFSKPRLKKKHTKNLVSYVKFCLVENEYYGIPYADIKEVINQAILTPLPYSPSYLSGIFNWRGFLLSVFDLKAFFYGQSAVKQKNNNILVIKTDDFTIGVLVSTIEGDDTYDLEKLEPPFSAGSIEPRYLMGLHEATTAIIDMRAILLDIKNK